MLSGFIKMIEPSDAGWNEMILYYSQQYNICGVAASLVCWLEARKLQPMILNSC